MTIKQIEKLQKHYGASKLQERILDGSIWKFEGSMGRAAMEMLNAGMCFLGTEATYDYYGNKIPPRDVLQPGTKGTLECSSAFWEKVEDGDDEVIEFLESAFASEGQFEWI